MEDFKSIKMDVGVDGGADPRIKFEIDDIARLLLPSMGLCWCFKTLRMACPFVDFKHINIPLFYKTTLFDPSSFDVLVFNTRHVSDNLSFKVSSFLFDSR
jgi:hypothetical protein